MWCEKKVAYCTVKTLMHNLISQEKLPFALEITSSSQFFLADRLQPITLPALFFVMLA